MAENRKNPPAGQREVNEAQRSHKMVQPDLAKGQKNGQQSGVTRLPSVSRLPPLPVAPPPPPEASQPTKE
jgi:hypothetical protein